MRVSYAVHCIFYRLEVITPENLTVAITSIDPELDETSKQAAVMWVFSAKNKAELDAASDLELNEVEARLKTKFIKRFF